MFLLLVVLFLFVICIEVQTSKRELNCLDLI